MNQLETEKLIDRSCKAIEYYNRYKHFLEKWPEKGMIVNDIAKLRRSKQSNASHFARTGYSYGIMDKNKRGQERVYSVNKRTVAFLSSICDLLIKEMPQR